MGLEEPVQQEAISQPPSSPSFFFTLSFFHPVHSLLHVYLIWIWSLQIILCLPPYILLLTTSVHTWEFRRYHIIIFCIDDSRLILLFTCLRLLNDKTICDNNVNICYRRIFHMESQHKLFTVIEMQASALNNTFGECMLSLQKHNANVKFAVVSNHCYSLYITLSVFLVMSLFS